MNVFELFATISLDAKNFNQGLKSAGAEVKKAGQAIKGGLKTAAKVTTVAVGAASTAVGTLVTKSVQAYADYEQLVGGVETLFGTQGMNLKEYAKSTGKTVDEVKGKFKELQKSQNTVLKNASRAYKAAGLSANKYMETVTTFAASLTQSLKGDTVKSAKYADMAIKDMSDNANKMGTDMALIQNAYQGFSKQNYSMLDNLKLGYGGTSQEMYRLLVDATKLNKEFKETAKFSIDDKGHLTAGFADITRAIHIVQKEMGITGTTAKEASHTISGSINSAKSAWQNLVTGLTDSNAGVKKLVSEFIDSAKTALKNLLPAVRTALSGVATAIKELAPIVAEELPKLISDVLPELLSAANGLIQGLTESLPTLLSDISSSLIPIIPDIIKSIINLFVTGIEQAANNTGKILKALGDLLRSIFDLFIEEDKNGDTLISKIGKSIFKIIKNAIKFLSDEKNIKSMASDFLTIAGEVVNVILTELPDLINTVIKAIPGIIKGLVNSFLDPKNYKKLETLVDSFSNAILKLSEALIDNLPDLISTLIDYIFTKKPQLDLALLKLVGRLIMGLVNNRVKLITKYGSKLGAIGKDIINGIWDGIKKQWDTVLAGIKSIGTWLVDAFKKFFKISSPSKVMRDQVGKFLAKGIGVGFIEEMKNVTNQMQNALPTEFDNNLDYVSDFEVVEASAKAPITQNFSVEINNPVVRNDNDIDRLSEQVSINLGKLFRQRDVAYG